MNAALGVLLHAIGGFAAGSFYMAFKKVKNWNWESYWLVNGLFTWIIMPWLIAVLTVPAIWKILGEMDMHSAGWMFLYGACWGIGNLTFGLSLRYLGMSLGMAMSLGLSAIFGTLAPPVFFGTFDVLTQTASGRAILLGIAVCLLGIMCCGWAGMSKEKELPEEKKQVYIKDFHFKKGIAASLFSGVMSACFAFGMQAGKPVADLSVQHGTQDLWKNSVGLIIIMGGGFLTNAGLCLFMNIRNSSFRNYFSSGDYSLSTNYLFCAIAGVVGFMEFMFYGMGATLMGRADFISFSIHLAFVIIFSSMWGLIAHEWTGCSSKTRRLIFTGILILMLSTVLMGWGNYLAS